MNRIAVTWNAYACILVIGMGTTIIGPVLPHIIAEYEISLTMVGALFTVLGFGRVLAVAFGGIVSDITGRKPFMLLGNILMVIGFLGFAWGHSWTLSLAFIFIAGIGMGFVDGGANAVIADIYPEKRGPALNRLHVFFGIGCLLQPSIAAVMLYYGACWRLVFTVTGIFILLLFLYTVFVKYPAATRHDVSTTTDRKLFRGFLTCWNFWLLGLILFIYTGVGTGIIGWINTYLEEMFEFSAAGASVVLALYNLGIVVGRMICSVVSGRLGYRNTLLSCAVGSTVSIGIATLATSGIGISTGYFLTGLFLTGLFPTAIAYGSDLFPKVIGSVSGVLITLSSLGSMLIPLLIGAIGDSYGLRFGMVSAGILTVLLILAAGLLPHDTNEC
jgi:fucose permease